MKNLVLAFVLVMIVSLMASDTFATDFGGFRGRRRISNAELRAIRRAQIRAQIRRDAFRFDSFDSCDDGFSDFRVRRRGIGFSFGY